MYPVSCSSNTVTWMIPVNVYCNKEWLGEVLTFRLCCVFRELQLLQSLLQRTRHFMLHPHHRLISTATATKMLLILIYPELLEAHYGFRFKKDMHQHRAILGPLHCNGVSWFSSSSRLIDCFLLNWKISRVKEQRTSLAILCILTVQWIVSSWFNTLDIVPILKRNTKEKDEHGDNTDLHF